MEPEKPDSTDCCGNGCSPCVFDIYEQNLKSWKENPHNGNTKCRSDLLSETRFKPFQLVRKEQLTEDVYMYQFQPGGESKGKCEIYGVLPYGIGQHLIVRCNFKSSKKDLNSLYSGFKGVTLNDESIITRAYTPVSVASEEKDCCFNIFVKIYNCGIGSEYFSSLQVGDISLWRGPYGLFKYKPNSFKHILMLCVGTGLAPMIPIASSILNDENDETVLHLMYGVRNIEHIIMRDSLRKMSQFWNFSHKYFFSENTRSNNDVKFGESFEIGRINEASISGFFQGKDVKKLQILICGTETFIPSMREVVFKLGIESSHVFVF